MPTLWSLPEASITSWERVAAAALAQANDGWVALPGRACEVSGVFSVGMEPFARAYRDVDSSEVSYFDLLAERLDVRTLTRMPLLADALPEAGGHIIACPFAVKPECELPTESWVAVLKHLSSYGGEVFCMGTGKQRTGQFPCMTGPWEEQVTKILSAALVVGVPNAWTWIRAACDRPMVVLYREQVPARRWFPFESSKFGRVLCSGAKEETPALVAGLRQLIADY